MNSSFRVPMKPGGSGMPTYQQQQQYPTPGVDTSARLSDSAAQVYEQVGNQQAKGLDRLGQGMEQAAKAGYDLYTDYQTGKAREKWNQYRAEEMTLQAKLSGKIGNDAIDPEKGVQASITAWQQEARERLGKDLGGMAKGMFDNAIQQHSAKLTAWGMEKHQAEERTYLNQQDEGSIALDSHAMLTDPMNETTANNSITNIKSRFKALRDRNGWSPEYAQAKMNGQMEQVFGKMVETQINSENITAARDLFNRYGAYLGSNRDTLAHKLDEKAQTVHTEAIKSLVMSGDMQGAQDYMNTVGIAPRGIRNNNPGNIVRTSGAWEGEVAGQDAKFKTFATPEQGIAAVGRNLLSYEGKGLNTISGIINRWAPPSENNTSEYVSTVSKALGVSPDAKLDMKDPAVLTSLTRAIIKHENGQMPYSDEQMQAGVDAALGKRSEPVIILDTVADNTRAKQMAAKDDIELLQLILQQGMAFDPVKLRAMPREQQLGYLVECGEKSGLLPAGFSAVQMDNLLLTYRGNTLAAARYERPSPSDCKLLLVRALDFANNPQIILNDDYQGWARFLKKENISLRWTQGTHESMLSAGLAANVAQLILEYLENEG